METYDRMCCDTKTWLREREYGNVHTKLSTKLDRPGIYY